MGVDQIDVLLNVSDVERSLSFYRDLIGMQLGGSWTDENGRTRWVQLTTSGGSSLMLNQPAGPALTDRASRPAYRDAVVYLRLDSVAELDAIHQRLCKSASDPGECRDEAYGQREFIVRDPDGYDVACAARLAGAG